MSSEFDKKFRVSQIPKGHAIGLILVVLAIALTTYLLILSMTGGIGKVFHSEELDLIQGNEVGSNEGNLEYVLPESSSRYYTREELESLTEHERYIAINEIYARYGRGFSEQDLRDHFNSCSWYQELYPPEEVVDYPSLFNEYEQANVDLLASMRS